MKLIFFSSDNIGDAILASIILELIAKTLPEVQIIVYNKNHNKSKKLFEQNPNIISVKVFSTKIFSYIFYQDLLNLWKEIARNDGVFVTSLLGSNTVMIGLLPLIFKQKLTGLKCIIFGMRQKLESANEHIISHNIREFEANVGVKFNHKIDANFLQNFIGDMPKKQQKTIAILAGASNFAKTLPAGKFSEIIKYFSEQGFKITLLGSESKVDKFQSGEIMRLVGVNNSVTDLVGKTDLIGYFAEIASAEYVITNDSSGQHIANVLETPCGVLWARDCKSPIVKAYAWQNEITANIFGKKYYYCKKCSILRKFFIKKTHCKACIRENYSKIEVNDIILQVEEHLAKLRALGRIS